jgi:carboxypeptidase C (cathepsin A)
LNKFLETETGKNLIKKIQKLFGYTDEQMSDKEFILEGTKKYIILDNPNLNIKDSDKIEVDFDEENKLMIVTINGIKYKNKNDLSQNFILIPYNSNEKEEIVTDKEEIVTDFDKNWDYMKKNNQYYAKRKNSTNWVLAKGEPEKSIKNKVFNLI